MWLVGILISHIGFALCICFWAAGKLAIRRSKVRTSRPWTGEWNEYFSCACKLAGQRKSQLCQSTCYVCWCFSASQFERFLRDHCIARRQTMSSSRRTEYNNHHLIAGQVITYLHWLYHCWHRGCLDQFIHNILYTKEAITCFFLATGLGVGCAPRVEKWF